MSTETSEIRGKSVLILGYGREGKSVHAWLEKHYPAMRIGIADKQRDGEKYLAHLRDYDTVIRSPGVSPYLPEIARFVKDGGYLTTATNIFFSRAKGVTIGITGTKGKSTTSSLIAHILSALNPDVRLVGNIGTPMLDELESATPETIFVIELSSHQLVDIRYSPHIAVLLDIVPEHLDYYPDFSAYKRAKENIFRFQGRNDHVIRESSQYSAPTKLVGNQKNIAAAVAVARFMKVPERVINKQLATFTPLPHRLEFVGEYNGIRFYNDSLATIPQATMHALAALRDDVATLLVGGYDRHLDYSELGAYLKRHPVANLILFPDTGEKIWAAVPEDAKNRMRAFPVGSMEEAVTLAYTHTHKGKICLLSPASASYNLFRDYADRGEQFTEWVRRLATREK